MTGSNKPVNTVCVESPKCGGMKKQEVPKKKKKKLFEKYSKNSGNLKPWQERVANFCFVVLYIAGTAVLRNMIFLLNFRIYGIGGSLYVLFVSLI